MIDRLSTTLSEVTVETTLASCEEIGFGSFAGGMIFVPVGSSITSLTWYAAESPGGTYLAANDEDGNAITQTVAAEAAYQLPLALYGCRALKAFGDAAGTILISLKG